jgi:hypothetical protein
VGWFGGKSWRLVLTLIPICCFHKEVSRNGAKSQARIASSAVPYAVLTRCRRIMMRFERHILCCKILLKRSHYNLKTSECCLLAQAS